MRTLYAGVFMCLMASAGIAQPAPAEEASGIARIGDHLLIVADDDPGAYFWYRLKDDTCPAEQPVCVITLDPKSIQRVEIADAKLGLDLEAVDLLADGRIAMLSERLHSVIGDSGVIVEYAHSLAEVGGRGLEGIAISRLGGGISRVATLWEGGYLPPDDLPPGLRAVIGSRSLKPVVIVHDIAPLAWDQEVGGRDKASTIELEVPLPAGEEPTAQRFRAPDLVWHEWVDGRDAKSGWIVLLSSQNLAQPVRYEHQWLQRFDLLGRPVGGMLDLGKLIPGALAKANWEGMGWFVPGESLVLIHDKPPKGVPSACVIKLPDDWRGYSAQEMLVAQETAYYRNGPQQAQPPDGTVKVGDVVRLVRDSGSYALVRLSSGDTAYVSNSSLRQPQQGIAGEGSKFIKRVSGAVVIDWAYSDGPGWLAIHLDEGTGSPGAIVGFAPLRPGWNQRISIPVELREQSKVWGVYYEDRGRVGKFEPADTKKWQRAGMCDSADTPATLCKDRRLAASTLVDVCATEGAPRSRCRDGLPIGVFMFTAVP